MLASLAIINRLIKYAWLLAIVVIAGMAVWPPWALEPYNSSKRQSVGYHPIWSSGQSVRAHAKLGPAAENPADLAKDPLGIDSFHLIIQCYVVASIALGATFLLAVFRPERENQKNIK